MAAAPLAGLLYARSPELPFPVGIGSIGLALLLSAAFAARAQVEIEPKSPSERDVAGGA